VLVVGIDFLDFLDGGDLLPCGDETMRTGREIVFDEPVKPTELVAGNSREHVVFDMVIHMPVEELHEGVDRESPAAEAEIGH